MQISVATFNIYKHEDFDRRLPPILAALRGARADIVCLQEVPDESVAGSIAAALGYTHVACVSFTRPDDGWSESLAVMSSFAVLEREAVELRPGVPNCMRVRLDAGGSQLDVYNTHLHPRDSDLRQREAGVILDRLSREPDVAAIVCGDFNAVPQGRTMAVVWPTLKSAYEMATGKHPETTFPTPLRPLAGRQPGFSERREAPPTDDESQAKAAIDYVLVRPGQLRVLAASIIGDAAGGEAGWPSDHYGMHVSLELA